MVHFTLWDLRRVIRIRCVMARILTTSLEAIISSWALTPCPSLATISVRRALHDQHTRFPNSLFYSTWTYLNAALPFRAKPGQIAVAPFCVLDAVNFSGESDDFSISLRLGGEAGVPSSISTPLAAGLAVPIYSVRVESNIFVR